MHEALLRQWGLLQGWLAEDAALLGALDGVKRASRDWAANDKGAAWLTHTGKRLKAAGRLASERPDLADDLKPTDRDYLAACRNVERMATVRKRRVQTLVGAVAIASFAGAFIWVNHAYLQEWWRQISVVRPYMRSQVSPYVLTAEKERALKPENPPFRECARHCPWMVVVPGGTFVMGSRPEEEGRDDSAGPQHEVIFANSFAVSKYEVTFDDWDACVAFGDCPDANDSGFGRGRQPVINVSWDDAKRYVAWLSTMTSRSYRLLSEAEWEYAARAGSQMAYSWGDEIGNGKANCLNCDSKQHGKRPAPVEVGSFAPNQFGLHDMHGNVWEWVEDCYHDNYNGAPTDGTAWAAGSVCTLRVLRGGSFYDKSPEIRSAHRLWIAPGNRMVHVGFRVARTLSP